MEIKPVASIETCGMRFTWRSSCMHMITTIFNLQIDKFQPCDYICSYISPARVHLFIIHRHKREGKEEQQLTGQRRSWIAWPDRRIRDTTRIHHQLQLTIYCDIIARNMFSQLSKTIFRRWTGYRFIPYLVQKAHTSMIDQDWNEIFVNCLLCFFSSLRGDGGFI